MIVKTLRQQKILELLSASKHLSVKQLAEIFDISPNSIRNDINSLSLQGLILKVHGGAAVLDNVGVTRSDTLAMRNLKNITEKRKIARIVVDSLPKKDGLSIFLDSATTAIEVASCLRTHPYKVTIITNFFKIIQILEGCPHISLFLLGGQWWEQEVCMVGGLVLKNIEMFHVNIALIGAKGICFSETHRGIFDVSPEFTEIKHKMMKYAQETWVIADSTKFGQVFLSHAMDFNNIRYIFTDKAPELSKEEQRSLGKCRILDHSLPMQEGALSL